MGNDREVEMNKGKTLKTLSGGKAWQKKQRNFSEYLTSTGVSWTHYSSDYCCVKIKNWEGELLPSVASDINF